jgi:hypothetical protein
MIQFNKPAKGKHKDNEYKTDIYTSIKVIQWSEYTPRMQCLALFFVQGQVHPRITRRVVYF